MIKKQKKFLKENKETWLQTFIATVFTLPGGEQVLGNFACRKDKWYSGHLFLTSHYVCFDTNLWGFQKN